MATNEPTAFVWIIGFLAVGSLLLLVPLTIGHAAFLRNRCAYRWVNLLADVSLLVSGACTYFALTLKGLSDDYRLRLIGIPMVIALHVTLRWGSIGESVRARQYTGETEQGTTKYTSPQ